LLERPPLAHIYSSTSGCTYIVTTLSAAAASMTRHRRRRASAAILAVACLASVILSVSVGSVPISPDRVVSVVAGHIIPSPILASATEVEARIIWDFRLPRALLGLVVGASLAVAGAVLQAVVRNPLADPFVFGVSSGASAAAVATITLGLGALVAVSVPAAAFVGALATTLLVFALAQRRGRVTPGRLILAGVAMSYLLGSVTSYLVLRASAPGGGVTQVLSWLSGSLAAATWADLGIPAVVLVVATVALLLVARILNALLIGDETAASLGVDVGRFRLMMFVITSLLVGVVVAVSGAIGFVGLVVPHAVRMVVGSDHRWVLPVSALAGALLLVVVDIGARLVIAPSELPVGLLTAGIGAPFFLWMLRRSSKGEA
jgi:iron complex transport system permease protein